MKKFLLFSLVSIIAVFCTGCVKYSYNIEINDKDKVSLSKTQAMNLSFFQNADPNFNEKFYEGLAESEAEYNKKGYEVHEYNDGTYTGMTLKKQNIDFEKAMDDLKEDFDNQTSVFSIQKTGLKKQYKIHLSYDLKQAMDKMSEGDSQSTLSDNNDSNYSTIDEEEGVVSRTKETDPETGEVVETIEYENGTVVTSRYNENERQQFSQALGAGLGSVEGLKPISELTIKIPKKATKHNATKVISDTEYYWDLAVENQPVKIMLEYEKFDMGTLGMIISVLVVLAILGIVFNNAKNGDLNGF